LVTVPDTDDDAWLRLVAGASGAGTKGREALDLAVWEFACQRARGAKVIRALGRDEDHYRSVAERVLAKLRRPSGLNGYQRQAATDRAPFRAWLSVVVDHTAIEYVRELRGRANTAAAPTTEGTTEVSAKSLLNLYAGSLDLDTLGTRPPYTEQQRIAKLVAFAEAHLSAEQLQALSLWLKDEKVPVSKVRAKRLVRAAIQILQDRFVKGRTRV
jgi:DNA-directed RNA polymerase specialized sigma24 family protein